MRRLFFIPSGSGSGFKRRRRRKKEKKTKKERQKGRKNERESDKDAGMRQGDMRQVEKAHWLRTDPGLENWICAGSAPGIKIWRDEPDEVARF